MMRPLATPSAAAQIFDQQEQLSFTRFLSSTLLPLLLYIPLIKAE